MKNKFLQCLILIFLSCSSLMSQKAKYVILITVDGLRPEFYLDPSWGMVNLNIMKQEGTYALGVNSVFPSATLPAHTSIVTGVTPLKHGIYYNSPFSPKRDSDEWYWYYDAINSPTLWEAVQRAGMRNASVNWPVTVGAPIDYNLPVVKKSGMTQLDATRPHCNPENLLEEIQREATGRLSNMDFSIQGNYLVQDQTMARIAAYLIREYKPNFVTVHLSSVDHFEHKEGRDGNMVRRSVSGADREIRTIIESIERAGIMDSTTVIITGDHGHVNINTAISPNIWLIEAGLLTDLKKDDWKAQFKTASGSAFLHLKDSNDVITLKKVKQLISSLPPAERKLFHVLDKNQILDAGGDPNAVLALTAAPGTAFNASLNGEVYKNTSGANHGHLPDFKEIQTGFIAFGAGIQKGKLIEEMNLVDIPVLIAYLLGIDFNIKNEKLIKQLMN